MTAQILYEKMTSTMNVVATDCKVNRYKKDEIKNCVRYNISVSK